MAIRTSEFHRFVLRRPLSLVLLAILTLGFLYYTSPAIRLRLQSSLKPTDAAAGRHPALPSGNVAVDLRKADDLYKSTVDRTEQERSAATCKFPVLDPFGVEVVGFFKLAPPLACPSGDGADWVSVRNGRTYISAAAERRHGPILCFYNSVNRVSESVNALGPAQMLRNDSVLTDDVLLVHCQAADGRRYMNLHVGVAPKLPFLNRYRNWRQRSAATVDWKAPNFLIVGFDSISHMNFIRSLPRSYSYLVRRLGSVVLNGFNIVGDGTTQALLAMLTGFSESELPEARRGFPGAVAVDHFPWIWRTLKRSGYVTQWMEDGMKFGTFTYRLMGFDESPVDYYGRPYFVELQSLDDRPLHICVGSRPTHTVMLDWVRELFAVYPDQPKFSFVFHSEYSHGDSNQVQVADSDLMDFLVDLETSGQLDRTVLIVMSDHGARFHEIRQVPQGKLEERLPFFSIRMPPMFCASYPNACENLKSNAYRLTTAFDVHETLTDILSHSGVGPAGRPSELPAAAAAAAPVLGTSLLRPIGLNRTCGGAGIAPHWCSCLHWSPEDPASELVLDGAEFLLGELNKLINAHRSVCRQLRLDRVLRAHSYRTDRQVLRFKQSADLHGRVADFTDNMEDRLIHYQLTVSVRPGGGLFEATIQLHRPDRSFRLSQSQISRIDRYGEQAACISDTRPDLRPFCYCHKNKPP